jgi:hypothetical protein
MRTGRRSLLRGELALPVTGWLASAAQQANSIVRRSRTDGKRDFGHKVILHDSPRQHESRYFTQKQKAPLRKEWRLAVLRWSLASQVLGARWWRPPSLLQTVPAGMPFMEGRSLAICSCRVPAVLGWRIVSSSRYITGAYLLAIPVPFIKRLSAKELSLENGSRILQSGSAGHQFLLKIVEPELALAVRTIMRPASGDQDSPDG